MNEPATEPFSSIRARCRWVANQACAVRIDASRIEEHAARLGRVSLAPPVLDPQLHYVGPAEKMVAFFVTLDSINFGSGYFPFLRKEHGRSGYGTIAQGLTARFHRHGPFRAEELASMEAADCAALFGQSLQSAPIRELMALFASALNDLGADMLERFAGSYTRLIEAANERAAALIGILVTQPGYRDVSRYRGRDVPFYKRAQILASDLALALGGTGWGRFRDLEQLTMFADNLVPHVLRVDGLLVYHPSLAARIDRQELLESGSEEEVEIRAAALDAVERLAGALRSLGVPTTSRDLDLYLWNRGQSLAYKSQGRRHRTRCPYY